MIEKLRIWWLIRIKVPFIMWNYHNETKRMCKKYCNKGFHKMQRKVYEFGTCKKKFEFLKCIICDQRFFATEKDRKNFKKARIEWKDFVQQCFKKALAKGTSSATDPTHSCTKPEHISRGGKVGKRGSSGQKAKK